MDAGGSELLATGAALAARVWRSSVLARSSDQRTSQAAVFNAAIALQDRSLADTAQATAVLSAEVRTGSAQAPCNSL